MKKSALLAVSALSLGVVGLATFTPMVDAAMGSSQEVTINAMVNEEKGIDVDVAIINLEGMGVSDMKEGNNKITFLNNSATQVTLNVKTKSAETALKNGEASIPALAGVAEGTSAWAVKGGNLAGYTAVTAEDQAVATATNEKKDVPMTYGVSTSADQASGIYTGTIAYSIQ